MIMLKGMKELIYLKSFKLSPFIDRNPHAYPDQVFKHMAGEVLLFDRITVIYGNNGSGKSTLLNLIANKLDITGKESLPDYGKIPYAEQFLQYCVYTFGEDERERTLEKLPEQSRYMKSEDLLYEIKKIQQLAILREGLLVEQVKNGMDQTKLAEYEQSSELYNKLKRMKFSQEKYSNGETTLQFFEQYLTPDSLYVLDEPETSLSPQNQLKLAEMINQLARYCNCQFIIATHSPVMLGTLHAKIYNLDAASLKTSQWYELEHVKFFYQFFKQNQQLFE